MDGMSTWTDVDERVLRWLASKPPVLEQPSEIPSFAISEPVPFEEIEGVDSREVSDALYRLLMHGFIAGGEDNIGNFTMWWQLRLGPKGLQYLGEWPDLDRVASALSIRNILLELAKEAPAEEQKALKRTAGLLARTSGEVVRDALGDLRSNSGGDGMTIWERRDFPVLHALANSEDDNVRHGFIDEDHAAEMLGLELSNAEIHQALHTLGDADYITGDYKAGLFTQLRVTGRGQQALGEWPLFTGLTPITLAALLDRLANEAPTDEEAVSARSAASYLRSLPPAAFKAVMRTVIVEGAKASVGLLT